MRKGFLIALGVALVVSGVAFMRTSAYFAKHRLAEGKIGKVRVLQVDENETLAILDFDLINDTDQPIVVRSLLPSFNDSTGSQVDGHMVAARDVDNIFRNYPDLGEKYNPPLVAQDTLPAKGSIDRMAAIRFDVPRKTFDTRKEIVLQIDTNGGVIAELKK
ncbi:MAG TPA: hypothetical protein VKB79_17300 [Bryobacteraceae bacterium]|nr:hypothetical protein [Bryobacteraceae bacterium]